MFVPKAGKYEYVTDKELFFLWAYVTDAKINLPLFILDHMFKATLAKITLPYGIPDLQSLMPLVLMLT